MSAPESPAARRVIAGLSVFVFVAVTFVLYGLPRRPPPGIGGPSTLATANALLNGLASLLLVGGFVFAKRQRLVAHRNCMVAAFTVSSLFLVTYLLHHATVGSVPYQGQGWLRAVYFAVLLPHIVLAAVVVPLALVTLRRGWVNDVARHRSIAKVTLPVWLYVSVSGVVLYFMLYP